MKTPILASIFICIAALVASAVEPSPKIEPSGDVAGFRGTIASFLAAHCASCHGPTKQEGELALHKIDGNVPTGLDIDTWKLVAERLVLGEMPPEGQKRPDPRERAAVVGWIKQELAKGGEDPAEIGRKLQLPGHGNRVDHEALFAANPNTPGASPSRLWRLSPQIYVSFVPRVAGKGHQGGQPFSAASGEGFKDYASLFVVDEPTINQLLRNSAQILDVQFGLVKFSKPLKEFQPFLNPAEPPTDEQIQIALRRQFQTALLREPTHEELSRFTSLLHKNTQDAGQVIGAKATLAAILMLPEALYRFEVGEQKLDEHGRRMLAPREIAYAVAFALTDNPPAAALLKAADGGQLGSREGVAAEVRRILADRKIAKPRIMRFFDEYFEYPAAHDVFKDLSRGQWRPEILIADTRQLIQHVLDQDRDVLKELLTTTKSFVNYRIDTKGVATPAKAIKVPEPPKIDKKTGKPLHPKPRDLEIHDLYSLPLDWKWTAEQPVVLPADERAGILTQPSWLAAFATNNENHAIRRGKWIRERLLGGVVPDLPISVDAQLPDAPEKTLRERMEITREEYCWQCHRKMNPIGLTFEKYDYLGRHRRAESVLDPEATAKNVDPKSNKPLGNVFREVSIDSRAVVEHSGDPRLDGETKDAIELVRRLADSPRVRQVFVRHAFRYWMGRNESLDDGPTLVRADEAYVASGGSMNALIASLLTSDAFLYRRPSEPNVAVSASPAP
ncbi:MAG: DUF1588 domain-containing protein [Pirellulaceae bacterium]|nr:DUF1588 domain-containing protein [Pirellulaceae bacterium]